MKSLAWKYLDRSLSAKLMSLSAAQQLVIVAGTYALAQAGLHIHSLSEFIFWILIALASHLFSPLFGLLIRPLEIQLSYKAYHSFLKEKLFQRAGTPSLWTQKNQREIYLSALGSETDSYLGAIIYVGLDVFSYILSLVLGVLVLGFVLDTAFISAFFISGILSGLCFYFLQKKITHTHEAEQNGRIELSGWLLQAWENIFFNNHAVVKNYLQKFESTFANSQRLSLRATRWSEILVVILSTASALPIFVTLFWMISQPYTTTPVLVGLLATIPRQLNLLATFRNLFQSTTSFISFEAKLRALVSNADLSEVCLVERIKTTEISINQQGHAELQNITDLIKEAPPQRLTVRGKNGAGKSTLLLHLNEILHGSFYLPANPQFNTAWEKGVSTGQNIFNHLKYAQDLDETYLLLDEWDANLDEENKQALDVMLDELSRHKVIVEVRHRP